MLAGSGPSFSAQASLPGAEAYIPVLLQLVKIDKKSVLVGAEDEFHADKHGDRHNALVQSLLLCP